MNENWPHCEECNFPLQDQGTPNGLVCLLCNMKDKRDALAQGLEQLIFSIESTHHDESMAQSLDLAKACLKENAP